MSNDPPKTGEVRILALDVGSKRIGLAVSDPLGLTAQGLGVLERKDWDRDLARLVDIARPYRVQEILVGLPRHMDGVPARYRRHLPLRPTSSHWILK